MPAMRALGVGKHHVVFFYHGRGEIEMGNAVWEAMEEWERREWRECERGRAGKEWGARRGEWTDGEGVVSAWSETAKHNETMSGARQDRGFSSGSVWSKGGKRQRVVVDEEEWPPIVAQGGQW